MTDNQFFVHLYSNSSDAYFPDNTPYRFTSVLPETISLSGRWYCALTELEYTVKSSTDKPPLHLAVHSDICKSSIAGSEKIPLLRYVPVVRNKGPKRIFHTPTYANYVLVNNHVIDRIAITIKPYNTSPETLFGSEPSRLSVHFSKSPPLLL